MHFYELAQYNNLINHPKLRKRILQKSQTLIRMGHCIVFGIEKYKGNIEDLELDKELPENKIAAPI
jgi:hypothetical protein